MYTCRIYKICNSVDDDVYVGSTKQKLGQRFSEHKSKARKGSKYKIHEHIRNLGADKFYIELLEEKEVADRQEQLKLEVLWQEKERSKLNKIRAQSTVDKRKELDKEYREKPDVKAKMKINSYKYKQNNRDKINERAAAYREKNRNNINKKQRAQRANSE